MADTKRLNLNFNLDSPLHREAWAVLSAIPSGHRTTAICRVVLAQQEQETLKTVVREVLREELKHVDLSRKPDVSTAGDDDAAALEFLRALQNDILEF